MFPFVAVTVPGLIYILLSAMDPMKEFVCSTQAVVGNWMKALDEPECPTYVRLNEMIVEALTKWNEVSMKRDRYCKSNDFQLEVNNDAEDVMDECMDVAYHAKELCEAHDMEDGERTMEIVIEYDVDRHCFKVQFTESNSPRKEYWCKFLDCATESQILDEGNANHCDGSGSEVEIHSENCQIDESDESEDMKNCT